MRVKWRWCFSQPRSGCLVHFHLKNQLNFTVAFNYAFFADVANNFFLFDSRFGHRRHGAVGERLARVVKYRYHGNDPPGPVRLHHRQGRVHPLPGLPQCSYTDISAPLRAHQNAIRHPRPAETFNRYFCSK